MSKVSPFFSEDDDAFLEERLNPLFLTAFRSMWKSLETAQQLSAADLESAQEKLLAFLFSRLFQPLYSEAPSVSHASVYFLSAIHFDGIGDFYALLKAARAFAKEDDNVHVVYRHQKELPKVDFSNYHLEPKNVCAFYEPTDYQVLEEVLEGKDTLSFEKGLVELERRRSVYEESGAQEALALLDHQREHFDELLKLKKKALVLYQELKSAKALVNIALAINTFENSDFASNSLYFAEAGNFQGIANYLQHRWFGMGLGAFEEGIFLEKVFENNEQWENKELPQTLWQTPTPSLNRQKQYFETNCLFLSYMTRISQQRLIFIYLAVAKQRKDPRSIDIVLPHFPTEDLDQLDLFWLKQQGISKVSFIDLKNVEQEQVLLDLGETPSKTLRLIHLFPIPSSDFEKLVGLSEDIVGCTGDLSLSECLAAGKVPYYEQRKHKIETWNVLQNVAQHLKLMKVDAYFAQVPKFTEQELTKVAEKLIESLDDPEFQKEWQELLQFIRKYYSLETSLKAHVNRHLLLQKFPELKELEDRLCDAFLKKEHSLAHVYEEMKVILDEKVKID